MLTKSSPTIFTVNPDILSSIEHTNDKRKFTNEHKPPETC